MGDRGGGIFGCEQGTENGEAGGKDTNVAFDIDPDTGVNRGPGHVGKLQLGQERDSDDAGNADAVDESLLDLARGNLNPAGIGLKYEGSLQATEHEQSNDSQTFRKLHFEIPKPRYWQDKNNNIINDIGGRDGVSNKIIIRAVAIGDRSVPIVGQRSAVEEGSKHQTDPPEDGHDTDDDGDDEKVAEGE